MIGLTGLTGYVRAVPPDIEEFRWPNTRTSFTTSVFEHRFRLHASGLFGADLPADRWMDRAAAAATYDRNFALVRTCGDRSFLSRIPGMGRVLWTIEKCTGLPLVGWADTHARLA